MANMKTLMIAFFGMILTAGAYSSHLRQYLGNNLGYNGLGDNGLGYNNLGYGYGAGYGNPYGYGAGAGYGYGSYAAPVTDAYGQPIGAQYQTVTPNGVSTGSNYAVGGANGLGGYSYSSGSSSSSNYASAI